MQEAPETFFNLADFVPDLRSQFHASSLGRNALLRVAIPIKDPEQNPKPVPALTDRQYISISDGNEFWFWEPDSLRSLFRGNKQPPVLGDYPEAYNDAFIIFDMHVLEIIKFFGDPRDAEMEEIYSTLRRRPDGKSLGLVHDYLWQAAALVLGTRPLSEAEFGAIMSRSERSCRTFQLGPTSRNYAASIRMTLGQLR